MSKVSKHWYNVAKQQEVELKMKDQEIMRLKDTNLKLAKRVCGIKI